eukprot:CCRYP_004898-RA/>CCRYP_004898-RA protein AED:0.53 eAED:-0.04 QI:0/-1/0/1/-1/1/1/0/170
MVFQIMEQSSIGCAGNVRTKGRDRELHNSPDSIQCLQDQVKELQLENKRNMELIRSLESEVDMLRKQQCAKKCENSVKSASQAAKQCTAAQTDSNNLLSVGLELVGFDKSRQRKAGVKLNFDRFRSNFGIDPVAIVALAEALNAKYDDVDTQHLLMTLNFFKHYLSEHIM